MFFYLPQNTFVERKQNERTDEVKIKNKITKSRIFIFNIIKENTCNLVSLINASFEIRHSNRHESSSDRPYLHSQFSPIPQCLVVASVKVSLFPLELLGPVRKFLEAS